MLNHENINEISRVFSIKSGIFTDTRRSSSSPSSKSTHIPEAAKIPQGAIGYYRNFIPNFAELAIPLYGMTNKNVRFKWSPKFNESWQTLKSALSSRLILVSPNLNEHFFIATNSIQNTIAAVLLQNQHGVLRPIKYFCRHLKDPETRYHTNEIEGLAIFAGYKRWEHFLLMNK